MANENNPAGRFLRLIVEGRQLEAAQPARKNFGRLLGVKGRPAIFKAVAEIMELPGTIKAAVESCPGVTPELLLRWVPVAESSFESLNLDAQWGAFIKPYTDHVLYGIEVCADTLSRLRPEATIDEDELANLGSLVAEVLAELDGTALDPDLCRIVRGRAQEIELALRLYRVRGIDAVKKAFENTMGVLAVQPESARDQLKQRAPSKLWDLLGKLAILYTLVTGTPTIATIVCGILPWVPVVPEAHAPVREQNHGDSETPILEIADTECAISAAKTESET